MAEKLGQAILELITDDRALDDGLKRAKSKADRIAAHFGAIGKRTRDVGARMSLAVTAPISAMAALSLNAFRTQSKAVASVEAALDSMGDAAGFTSEELQKMASQLQGESLFGDEEILSKVTANLLTFGNLSGEVFERTQQAAADLSARLGQDLQSSAIQLGKALNDPAQGLTALTRIGVAFTEQQKEQIKAMAEAGDIAGAQALMLAEIEKQYSGQAAAAAEADQGVTQLANSWGDFQEQIGAVVAEFIGPLTQGLKSVVGWLQAMDPETRKWAVGLSLAAAAIGPLLAGVGLMATAIGGAITAITTIGGLMTATFVVATGPVGLAVAAVAGLTAAWMVWGDDITRIVSETVGAITSWLKDKLGPVFDWVGDKVEAVTGFFADMYDAVVGNSWVPDMVDRIGEEFGRLDGEMVGKARTATENTTGLFEGMEEATGSILGNVRSALGSFIETGKLNVSQFVTSVLQDLARLGINQAVNGISAALGSLFSPSTAIGDPINLLSPGPQANGGSFTVGGAPGIDQNLVAFRATRGERVDVTPAGRSRDGGGNVIINNHPPAGHESEVSERRNANGDQVIDIITRRVGQHYGLTRPATRT